MRDFNSFLYSVPNEEVLLNFLQKQVAFSLGSKTFKRGKLILFRKIHYSIQISIVNDKQAKENFEIPIPFCVEPHFNDGLVYFDYRVQALKVENLPTYIKKPSSNYFNKILEISLNNR